MKHAFLAAALLAGASLAAAPAAHAQSIRVGVRGGLNYSNLSGDLTNEDQYESKFGPHAGVMLNIGLTDDSFLSVQPELLFSQKGFKYADTEINIGNNRFKRTGKINYNYLDLPVLLRINADGLIFEGGPQVGYLISVSDDVKTVINGQTSSNTSNYRNLDDVNRTELGYAAGVGYQSDMGLLIGLRYNGGLSKFGKDESTSDFKNARNSAFMLSLGYMFGGK